MNENGQSYETTSDDRNYAMFTHIAALGGYIIPFGNVIGPLVVWLMKKDQSSYVDEHGKASVNFQISLIIWSIVCIPLIFVIVGIFLLIALGVVGLVYLILNAIGATKDQAPSYPISIRFIR